MTKLRAAGRLLTASTETRELRYLLLPYGEPGNTNKGKVIASAGTLEVPAEPLPVNLEHNEVAPVGTMLVTEEEAGLIAAVSVANTRAGDDVLEEATAGLRKGISVEVEDYVIRAGRFIKGRLTGAGLVVKPAYPSALLMAADAGELSPDLEAAAAAIEAGDLEAAAAAIAAAQEKASADNNGNNNEESDTVNKNLEAGMPANTAALLAGLMGTKATAPAGDPAPGKLEAGAVTLSKFTAAVRAMSEPGNSGLKAAAFHTISQADMYDPAAVPAYLGEVWGDVLYTERFAPLVSTADLTGMEVTGWRWEAGKSPIVDDWEPSTGVHPNEVRNEIPTGEMVAKKYSEHAKRIAGGNRFDRVHIDFPVAGVLESFLKEQAEYIKKRRDARVREHIYAAAKQITGTGADVASTWAKIILGAMHCMDYAKPTYAIVGNDLYRPMLATDMLENLALLETTLGLESGSMAGFRIQPASITDTASNGKVVVGAQKATVLHEPAGAPFRVDAQELLTGAVDKAVFSYYLLRSDERGGIYEVN